ncbi:MAG: formate dehydrogenase accessory sulfurtransferase FdhD, partial [Bacteroidota bacterium]
HQSRSVAITMRTPGEDTALALGFLFAEGILTEPSAVLQVAEGAANERESRNTVTVTLATGVTIDWPRLERHGYTSSSCGVCGKTSLEQVYTALPFGDLPGHWQIPAMMIPQLPPKLREAQTLFTQTGGIHAAGLFDQDGQLLHFAEDVGRHNALDKLIGYYFQQTKLPLREYVLVLSGRASFELIQKAAMAGIGFVVAVGAPSSLAVELAEELGMTLCGFTRNNSFNCYCGAERISI